MSLLPNSRSVPTRSLHDALPISGCGTYPSTASFARLWWLSRCAVEIMPRIFANMKSRPRAWLSSANASQTIRVLSVEFLCIRTDPHRRKIPPMIRKAGIIPKKTSDDSETDANSRLGRGPDVSNSERSILDNSPLPMATLAGSNHILRYVNRAFCRLVSKSEGELTGKPFIEAVPWEGCLALLNRVYK